MTSDDRVPDNMENDDFLEMKTDKKASVQAQIVSDLEGEFQINSEADMRAAFASLRDRAEATLSAGELTLIYRRGADMLDLLDRPLFQQRVGDQLDEMRQAAKEEFARNARFLNQRVSQINARTHYSEEWHGEDPARYGENL